MEKFKKFVIMLYDKIFVYIYNQKKVYCKACCFSGKWMDCDMEIGQINGNKFAIYFCPECGEYEAIN